MLFCGNDVLSVPGIKGNPIDGVFVKQLKRIPDERGAIFHMLRNDDPLFIRFGEIYFATVHPGVIKGWHHHREMTLNYAVIQGMIKLVLFDGRKDSPTVGNLMEVFMGEENYLLVQIPPGVWNGTKGMGTKTAMIANCATLAHDPGEMQRKDPFTNEIPYDWSLKHG